MSFEIIDNTFQVIVLAAMALLAFILAFRRSSRSCLILAFGYASFMMGTLYYLLHLIILGHGPQVFYVAECSWMASYFFFLSLEILYWEGLRPPFSPFALAAGVVIAGVVMRVQVFGPGHRPGRHGHFRGRPGGRVRRAGAHLWHAGLSLFFGPAKGKTAPAL